MKTIAYLLAVVLLVSPAWGQSGARLNMDLDHLEEKADEVVSVNLDGKSLEGGQKLLALRKGVTAPVRKLLGKLKGVYMRRFWFGRKKAYDEKDVARIHQQMTGPGWAPMIEVKDRKKSEAVAVYSYMENEEVAGMTVVSQEEQEFTIVNIVGPVDLETLSSLGGQMGIPAMKIATTELPAKVPAPARGPSPQPAGRR